MKCDGVPDFHNTIEKYIDINNLGQNIHKEIKKVLITENYNILKKILLNDEIPNNRKQELDDYLKTRPILDDTIFKNQIKMKNWDEKFKIFQDSLKTNTFTNNETFCENFDFNDEINISGLSSPIPLLDTIDGKQFVLGRQRNLISYYDDKINFITLNSKFWEPNGYLNNVFIECSIIKASKVNLPNKFPIRIVLSPNLFEEPDQHLNITRYDQDYKISTVLSKELCQYLKFTDFDLYQSRENLNIFFISKKDILHDPNKFIKISVDSNSQDDRYILKYLKYKNKYLNLKKNNNLSI